MFKKAEVSKLKKNNHNHKKLKYQISKEQWPQSP
jgi:hypothetical protein